MINAIDNADVNPVYEILEDNRPKFEGFDLGNVVYDYDNLLEEQINLKEVITLNLFKTITSMNNKLINGRIKDKDAEKIRIDYLKTYVSACNCFINLINKGNVNVIYDKNKVKDFVNLDDAIFNDAVIEDKDNE